MSLKINNISSNLVLIMQEIVNNQTLCKYLNYNQSNPLTQANLTLPANSLIMTKVFPYPFDVKTEQIDISQLRIYYPKGDFGSNQVIENTDIWFDIVVAKSKELWLVNDGTALIRPYEIMKNIINHFDGKSVSTVGRLKFNRFYHVSVNEKFDCVRLVAEMFTIG